MWQGRDDKNEKNRTKDIDSSRLFLKPQNLKLGTEKKQKPPKRKTEERAR